MDLASSTVRSLSVLPQAPDYMKHAAKQLVVDVFFFVYTFTIYSPFVI